MLRANGFSEFPLDGDGGIVRALSLRPRGAPGPRPRVLSGGHGASRGVMTQLPGGGPGLTGSLFSHRCCRTAPKPAGKWSCTGELRSARTSSASWTSTRTCTRAGSACSSSWSGECPPRSTPAPKRGWASSSTGDAGGRQPVSRRDAGPGRGAGVGVGGTGTWQGLRCL